MVKKGFTLAETLITLTIIGIIAALTIPNLINNYKKYKTEVKIKTAYSMLSNAIKLVQANHGDINSLMTSAEIPNNDSWYTETISGASLNQFANLILEQLKVEKDCGMVNYNQGGSSACLNEIYGGTTIKRYDGTSNAISLTYHRTAQLKNGMIIAIGSTTAAPAASIHVDVNNKKGPNQIGYDVFSFTLYKTDVKSYGSYAPNNALYGGFQGYGFRNTWLNLDGGGAKELKCKESGEFCTTVIQKNGWKIPDDYPVKKW